MGLLSWFGSKLGETVEKIGDTIGNATGWYGISDAGLAIQNIFSGNIARESSYDKNVANVLTTERLNEMLVSFSEEYLHHCERLEEQCVEEVERYCNTLIQLIRESSELTKNTSNLKRAEKSLSRIRSTIIGSVKEPLAKRMSLDDSECLKILKQESGKEKKEKMRKFSKKIINEALDNLGLKVREAIREQTEEIESFFRNNIELQEKETVTAKYQYDEMLRESVLKEADIEKISIRSHIILKATELLEDML